MNDNQFHGYNSSAIHTSQALSVTALGQLAKTPDAQEYLGQDQNLQSFPLAGRQNQVLHALLAAGVNSHNYQKVSIKEYLAPSTQMPEADISRAIKSLKTKNIINTEYIRNNHELQIMLLPRNGWKEQSPKKEKDDAKNSRNTDEINNITSNEIEKNADRILCAVQKYCENKNQKEFINEIDNILKIK